MKKTDESKRRSFFKNKPQNLYKLINSVSCKIFEAHPFNLLTSKENKEYAKLIVKECGVTEKGVHKIIKDSFKSDSIILEVVGEHHEVSEQGEAIYKGYTKAIEALEKVAEKRAVIDDKSYSGCSYGKKHISLREALTDDIKALKKKRAAWASLFVVHPELKEEPISKTAMGMLANQAYNLFLYIKKCHDKSNYKAQHSRIYELISELFMAIYDHPLFNASEKFTPKKIKEYCDNIGFHSKKKKTNLRKELESL